jgi:hypothetical protein
MKKMLLGLGLLLSVTSFSQNDFMQHPFEGDNQLVQIVPTIENREVSMEFVDTMMYRGDLRYDSVATSVINERYKEVLSQYKKCEFEIVHIGINVWNETKYDYGVEIWFAVDGRGGRTFAHLDLYNVEMSSQKGTLKEDLIEVFEKTIIQHDKQAEYERTHPLEPLEDVKMF